MLTKSERLLSGLAPDSVARDATKLLWRIKAVIVGPLLGASEPLALIYHPTRGHDWVAASSLTYERDLLGADLQGDADLGALMARPVPPIQGATEIARNCIDLSSFILRRASPPNSQPSPASTQLANSTVEPPPLRPRAAQPASLAAEEPPPPPPQVVSGQAALGVPQSAAAPRRPSPLGLARAMGDGDTARRDATEEASTGVGAASMVTRGLRRKLEDATPPVSPGGASPGLASRVAGLGGTSVEVPAKASRRAMSTAAKKEAGVCAAHTEVASTLGAVDGDDAALQAKSNTPDAAAPAADAPAAAAPAAVAPAAAAPAEAGGGGADVAGGAALDGGGGDAALQAKSNKLDTAPAATAQGAAALAAAAPVRGGSGGGARDQHAFKSAMSQAVTLFMSKLNDGKDEARWTGLVKALVSGKTLSVAAIIKAGWGEVDRSSWNGGGAWTLGAGGQVPVSWMPLLAELLDEHHGMGHLQVFQVQAWVAAQKLLATEVARLRDEAAEAAVAREAAEESAKASARAAQVVEHREAGEKKKMELLTSRLEKTTAELASSKTNLSAARRDASSAKRDCVKAEELLSTQLELQSQQLPPQQLPPQQLPPQQLPPQQLPPQLQPPQLQPSQQQPALQLFTQEQPPQQLPPQPAALVPRGGIR